MSRGRHRKRLKRKSRRRPQSIKRPAGKRDPGIEPHPGSVFWLASDSSRISENFDESLLVVRLGMAYNAIIAQNRSALVTADGTPGPADLRDRMNAVIIAAALAHETADLIRSNYRASVALAKHGGAPDETVKKISSLTAGTHRASPSIGLLRKKLGFHWDSDIVAQSLLEFTKHESVVWVEGKADTPGEAICRLSADVLTNALWPESSRAASMSLEERQTDLKTRSNEGVQALASAMGDLSSFIHYVLVGFFKHIQPTTHRTPSGPKATNAGEEERL